jgi:putative transposase
VYLVDLLLPNNETNPEAYTAMSKNNVVELSGRDQFTDSLTELLRTGARQLIQQAVEAELAEFMAQYKDQPLNNGRAAVVRNGYQPEREIQTGIGPVTVKIPKVRAKNGKTVTFRSALVPPYVRKTRSLEAALPWLYLKEISTGEMASALEVLIGSEAKGLSASTVARLKQQWADDYRHWCDTRLVKDQWVYIWADGVYSGLRAEDAKPLCLGHHRCQ